MSFLILDLSEKELEIRKLMIWKSDELLLVHSVGEQCDVFPFSVLEAGER